MNLRIYNNALNDYKAYISEDLTVNEGESKEEKALSFGEVISNEMNKLNEKQVHADKMVEEFISGQGEDLHSIMIATEEARLSLELAVQIRNKIVDALNTVNNMQL